MRETEIGIIISVYSGEEKENYTVFAVDRETKEFSAVFVVERNKEPGIICIVHNGNI